jgi:hypothetical protein
MNYPNRTGPPHRSVVRRRHAGRVPRSRSVIAMAAITTVLILWVFGGAHCGLLRSGSAPPRPLQPVPTAQASPIAGTVDQPHLDNRSAASCHKVVMIAVLPPSSSTVLAGLGAVIAPVAVPGWHAQPVASAGRGPPRGIAEPLTGRDRLTRFCLARR